MNNYLLYTVVLCFTVHIVAMEKSPASDLELIEAIKSNNQTRALELLSQGANSNTQDHLGSTALMAATFLAHEGMVKELISSGADINLADHLGRTALVKGCSSDEAIIKILIAAGATLHVDTNDHSWYVSKPFVDTVYAHFGKELFKTAKLTFPNTQDKEIDPVGYKAHMQILTEGMSKARAFAAEYRFVDLVDEAGNTPLHYAVLAGNRPVVVLLLSLMAQAKRAASVTHKNNDGYTPIDIAVVKSPKYILPVFVRVLGIKINVT